METPTSIIIFGGTGDLAQKKLFSALLDLSCTDHLPKSYKIIGFAREGFSDQDYRNFVHDAIQKKGHDHDEAKVQDFLKNIHYQKGDLNNVEDYKHLGEHAAKLFGEELQSVNTLLYLAVSPALYEVTFKNLHASGVAVMETGWTRILVEKPFGRDLETAKDLDHTLGELFDENQIYRIDHYLAKNAIQNIIAFRFSNRLFENSWNNQHIEKIKILLRENRGIEGRGGFYSATGALRDVGQNHLLQLVALLLMENPGSITEDNLAKVRADVLEALHVHSKDELKDKVIRAQYDGYKETEGVEGEGCSTETYFKVEAEVENDRWHGVPIFLESGKGMSEDKLEVTVHFKQMSPCICGSSESHDHKNVLKMSLQPDEKVSMQFWTKKPGLSFELEHKHLAFDFEEGDDKVLPDAYEKVLYDAISGDQTLFVSTREVEAAWKFISNIIDNWEELPLLSYERGSNGPEQS